MTVKNKCLLFLAAAGLPILQSWGQSAENNSVKIGTRYSIQSKILGEEKTFWVSLPGSYSNPKYAPQAYPVMYVLDGKSNFIPLVGLVNFMSSEETVNYQIPEMIIVAIDHKDRMKDLTPNYSVKRVDGSTPENPEKEGIGMTTSGGGEKFHQFLKEELMPKIETEFRALPYRVYIGHSLGGLNTVHTLLNHPGVFDGYISVDGSLWWDGASMIKQSKTLLEKFPKGKKQNFFYSLASEPWVQQLYMETPQRELFFNLREYAPANLRWKFQYFENEDHSSVPLLTWYNGLQFLFEGYEPNLQDMMQDLNLIEKHFNALEEKTGLRMVPPQTLFDILGHYFINRYIDYDKALEVLNIGARYYPNSPDIHQKLGKTWGLKGDKSKAIAEYESALKFNPSDKETQKELQDLKKN